ncbi:hypothetical protein [Kitasatospora griseola]|uniref:hypothetical protein n=1 Tax=Kitasatospora griseola TaxID=2064 RepID=UPI003804DEE6
MSSNTPFPVGAPGLTGPPVDGIRTAVLLDTAVDTPVRQAPLSISIRRRCFSTSPIGAFTVSTPLS